MYFGIYRKGRIADAGKGGLWVIGGPINKPNPRLANKPWLDDWYYKISDKQHTGPQATPLHVSQHAVYVWACGKDLRIVSPDEGVKLLWLVYKWWFLSCKSW